VCSFQHQAGGGGTLNAENIMLTTLSTVNNQNRLAIFARGTNTLLKDSEHPAVLTTDDLEVFSRARSSVRLLKPGQTIIQQGEPCSDVFIMLDGWAMCQKLLENGSRQILDLAMPGNIFGFSATGISPFGVEAKTTCRVAVLSRQAFCDALLAVPSVCLKCAEIFAQAENRALERLSQMGRYSARERVAGLIVELVTRLRKSAGMTSHSIELPLTQLDIADMLGLAHETVCRVLVAMRKDRLTTWRSGKLEIHNILGLMKVAGIEPESMDNVACEHQRLAA
jgi:CRP/FNR family transcriptional regulator, anaerobic regulatory protein